LGRRSSAPRSAKSKIHNPADNSELLIAKILATLGEYDNLLRREHLQRGRLSKARQGHTVTRPPCGYVRRNDGAWVKHPPPDVQAAVYAVFRIFLEVGSCPKTVQAYLFAALGK
jgi:DNA invertase Pin-like site-specific DNA recombinase